MGYTTTFIGEFEVTPPLNEGERNFIDKFSETRRVVRDHPNDGKYYITNGTDNWGQDTKNIIEHNRPPEGQPGLWCQWSPTEDGNIYWDGGEKFYNAAEWITYIIEHFLRDDALMKYLEPETYQKHGFVPHKVNGIIYAVGESSDDIWRIIIKDNKVQTQELSKNHTLFKHITKDEFKDDDGKFDQDAYYDALYEAKDEIGWEDLDSQKWGKKKIAMECPISDKEEQTRMASIEKERLEGKVDKKTGLKAGGLKI